MYRMPNFWIWFFKGQNASLPGWRGIFDGWMILHAGVGYLSFFIIGDLGKQAETVIFPFCGILLGVTFAWSGNITALLSTDELSKISDHCTGGIQEYVFSVHRSILVILLTVVCWCVFALSGTDNLFSRFICYALSSYSIRESWHVISFAQYMTISRKFAADILRKKQQSEARRKRRARL